MHKKGLVLIMTVLALFGFFGCKKPEPEPEPEEEEFGVKGTDGAGDSAIVNESGIQRFSYSYGGSIGGDSWSVTVERQEDGSARVLYEAMEYDAFGDMETTAGPELLEQLNALYLDHKLARWDGYRKYDSGVLDGSGFSLNIDFNDKGRMSASGDNCWPEGYRAFETAMKEILGPYLEEMIGKGKQAKIEEGVSGELDTVMINYIPHGDSGFDRYEMLIYRYNEKSSRRNFDVRIHSNGEFIEKGDYNYYCNLPDEDIGFEKIAELIEKYDVIQWYGWDKPSADPGNSEWFQLSFSFENGQISAMGTEHPENYDAFRAELLQHIVSVIKNAEAKYEDFRSR